MLPKLLAVLIAGAALGACATLPIDTTLPIEENGAAETEAIERAGLIGVAAPSRNEADFDAEAQAEAQAQTLLQSPLTADGAVRLALLQNRQLRADLAALGIARADVVQAGLISNPTLAVGALRPEGGGRWQLDFGLSQSLIDVMTRSLRRSAAQTELERVRLEVAARLTDLLLSVQQRYYAAVAARHRAAIAALAAAAAATQGDLATQFQRAGNLTELAALLQITEAQTRRLEADQAQVSALRARSELAASLGEGVAERVQLPEQLPQLPDERLDRSALIEQALRERLDLQAARLAATRFARELALHKKAGGIDTLDVGVKGERESDGATNIGPEMAISLPLFDNGSARIAAAQARLRQSEARAAGLEIAIRNEVAQAFGEVDMQRQRVQRYRTVIIPQRERIVALSVQQANFMLTGPFEMLLAKQQEYAAYRDYVDGLGAYWRARAELAKAVGRAIPHSASAPPPALDEKHSAPASDHSKH